LTALRDTSELGHWQRYMLAHAIDAEPGQRLVTLREAEDADKGFHWWHAVALTALADLKRNHCCLVVAFATAQTAGGRVRPRQYRGI
jgi:hypothetical protein